MRPGGMDYTRKQIERHVGSLARAGGVRRVVLERCRAIRGGAA